MFTKEETEYYGRHFLLPGIGREGQEKLKRSSVLVIGAGGLGCPALAYLAAAGAGRIGIVDFDRIEASNLQRQVLFTAADIGQPKAEVAARRLREMNPNITVCFYNTAVSPRNILALISEYDLVIDGTDNFPARYLINDACAITAKPLVHGSVYRFEGQLSVFFAENGAGPMGPGYRDLFPAPPVNDDSMNCSNVGVMGVLPGIIGTLQACEAIKILCGIGKPLSGRLITVNALTMEFSELAFSAREKKDGVPRTAAELESTDYGPGCMDAVPRASVEIDWAGLISLQETAGGLTVVDVRNRDEMPDAGHLADMKIPLAELRNEWTRIPENKAVVFLCKSGARSLQAALLLRQFGYQTVFSLRGGISGLLSNSSTPFQ